MLAAAAGGIIFLLADWPFSPDHVAENIQKRFQGTVEIRSCRRLYFPHPGCVAGGVTLRTRSGEPFITARRVTIEGTYASLLSTTKHLLIRGEGVRLIVTGSLGPHFQQQGKSDAVVDRFEAEDSAVDIRREGKPPLVFVVHHVVGGPLARGKQAHFRVALTNPKPQGEITGQGTFGPWSEAGVGALPVSGSYRFERADLDVFPAIGGTLNSNGRFNGTISDIGVDGTIRCPDFMVKESGHRVDVRSRFHADVNATNGDIALRDTTAGWGNTEVTWTGTIARAPGEKRRTVKLDISSHRGRIQDLMLVVMHSKPTLEGPEDFTGKVVWPLGKGQFIKVIDFTTDFTISDARFTFEHVQESVDKLSERARGDKDNDPERVLSDLKGHIVLRNGIAHVTKASLAVPAASAEFGGTCNLVTKSLNFDGRLRMHATVSQASTGIKSVLLKVVDPFFKRKHAGADLPVQMKGTIDHPQVGLDLKD